MTDSSRIEREPGGYLLAKNDRMSVKLVSQLTIRHGPFDPQS